MKKKIKLYIFIAFLLIIFLLFLFIIFKPYDYEKKYNINKFQIEEVYNKNRSEYTFLIKNNDVTYFYKIQHKYLKKRELIKDIFEYQNNDEVCIMPNSNKIDFYPLCSKNNEVYSYYLSNVEVDNYKLTNVSNVNTNYQKITIDTYANNYFLIFNYRGFDLLNESKNETIELFNRDIYSLNLIYEIDDYIIIPDYNEEYYFNKIYIINIKTGKVKEIKLDNGISFTSTFLGDYKNKVYLLDKKEEKEYVINLRKNTCEEVDFVILENNKLVKKTFKEIINNNLNFIENVKSYIIENNTLYLKENNNKIKISNMVVNKIVKVIDDTVYYLVNGNLYMHNFNMGEVKLLENFEWNFNNTNMIFITK